MFLFRLYLETVIRNNRTKVLNYQETQKKIYRPEEEPDDIKLAKANSERRLESKWPSLKETTTSAARIEGKGTEDERTELPRSRSLARSMRTRSSSGYLEDESLQQPFQVPEEVSSAEFYGNSTSRRANLGLSHETRSSTRVQDRDRAPRQLRPREPSPPPLTLWTRKNPNWTKDWHNSIIYPAIGKDRARVDMGDIEKLDDGEFLNDNLIAFYLRWLQDQLERQHPELAKRIYFQNTFFYQKLSKPERGIKGINYEAIKKWTSKVDLLSKDYIIIPINEHSHWYVAIICNAPKLLPGAVTTEHSQSQDTGGPPGDEHTNTEDVPKAAPLVPSKQFPESANGGDVDLLMKDVSLEDKKPEVSEALYPVSNGILEGQEAIESEDPPPANVTSDLLELETAKESQTKRTKRKSMPPQRKYNPKEFRIITLDSLGSSHTTTCSNLKDYLVLEIKDKKNIDIERPGSIGTTAKGIPTQNNYYDCGLFLLSYVEMFLKSPDEFVSGILQNDSKEYQMPKALEMRTHIRDLLFRLQKEQFAEAERLAKLKGKGKKSSKTEDKCGSALTSKSPSREASKSVRVSPDGRTLDESRDAQEKAIQHKPEPSRKENPPKSQTSASIEPPISFAPGKSGSPSLN
jgi:sentrin-specific protease 7